MIDEPFFEILYWPDVWVTEGHVDKVAYARYIELECGVDMTSEEVYHAYYRFIPIRGEPHGILADVWQPGDRGYFWEANKGRGAKPMTCAPRKPYKDEAR